MVQEKDSHSESVAPFAGAWIEIRTKEEFTWQQLVAPFAGAWIEMQNAKKS